MSNIALNNFIFERAHVEIVNNNKVRAVYDFAFGEYLAHTAFFDELSRIQTEIVNGGTVTLNTGQTADMDDVGGLLAVQIHIQTVEAIKEAMLGLSRLGLKNENKLWQLQG